jgi:hypothetical protein
MTHRKIPARAGRLGYGCILGDRVGNVWSPIWLDFSILWLQESRDIRVGIIAALWTRLPHPIVDLPPFGSASGLKLRLFASYIVRALL